MKTSEFEVIQTEPAEAWHCGQKIVVNEAGRQRLIKALQNKESEVEVFCCDGEGYYLELIYGEDYVKPFYLIVNRIEYL